jgi:hypothetical protein
LQAYTAYYNVGSRTHTMHNGFAVTSGGVGEGQWHRSAWGSNDYSYNQGLDEAYQIRPSPALLDRFAAAGQSVMSTYTVPHAEQGRRDVWTQAVKVERGPMQRFDMLANCAEFAAGSTGADCAAKLRELMDEMAIDNLGPGILCAADVPEAECVSPQQFMVNSMMVHSFHRYIRNHGDPTGALTAGVAGHAERLAADGIDKRGDAFEVGGCWADGLACTLDGAGQVDACRPAPNGEGLLCMYDHNRPHTLAMLMIGHELDPSIGLCALSKAALEEPSLFDGTAWRAEEAGGAGWTKPTSQMMQGLVFAVGAYDTCSD